MVESLPIRDPQGHSAIGENHQAFVPLYPCLHWEWTEGQGQIRAILTSATQGANLLFINGTRTVEKWSRIVGLDSSGKVIADFSPGILPPGTGTIIIK
jgi:hypothetical protein